MRTGDICTIRALENGVAVCVRDPAIVKANNSAKGGYQDPEREYAFPDLDKAMKWVKENAGDLMSKPDAKTEFNETYDAIKD